MRSRYIDSWRAIAVLLVVLSHLSQNVHIAVILKALDASFMATYGPVGVFIFFFISGHVVSRVCLQEIRSSGTFNIRGFYIRRIFRIAPPLLIYLTVCALLGVAGLIKFPMTEFIGASLYLCNSTQQLVPCGYISGHTWSLAFEEQFYLLFPMVFAAIELRRRIHPTIILALGLSAVPFLLPIPWIGRTGFIIIYCLFSAGFLFAKYEAAVSKVLARAPTAFFIAAVTATFFPALALESLTLGKYYKFVYVISIPVMVVASSLTVGGTRAVFDSIVLSYFGRISYSIYLWQQLVTSETFHQSALVVQGCSILLVVAWCALSFQFIERPLIDWGRRLSNSPKSN